MEFPKGAEVDVHYHPRHPERCALLLDEEGMSAKILFLIGGSFGLFGLIFAGIGIWLAFKASHTQAKKNPKLTSPRRS